MVHALTVTDLKCKRDIEGHFSLHHTYLNINFTSGRDCYCCSEAAILWRRSIRK